MSKKYLILLAISLVVAAHAHIYEAQAQTTALEVTRGQFAKALYRTFVSKSRPTSASTSCFRDLSSADLNTPYICAAYAQKFFNGYDNGTFKPNASIKLVEALSMAYKASGLAPLTKTGDQDWYEPYIEFAHRNKMISKYALLPDSIIRNSQMSRLISTLHAIKTGEKNLASVRRNLSVGCGKTPPSAVPSRISVGGVERSFITSVPRQYTKDAPTKLVFAFHGRTNSNSMVKGYYRVEEASAGEAIFIYPSGLRSGSSYNWSSPGDSANNLRDFALFDALLEKFSTSYCIDLDQIYVVGHSLGGWFTDSLACARGDVIRGVASVGGGTTIMKSCSGPVAAMVWHNPKDNLVAFSQGEAARDQIKKQNQCGNATQSVEPRVASCRIYTGCNDDAPLIWCPYTESTDYRGAYYPHTWPRSAGSDIWNFFESLE